MFLPIWLVAFLIAAAVVILPLAALGFLCIAVIQTCRVDISRKLIRGGHE